jgi:glycosyltransferase involved in cell wall biosynthesis
MSLEKFPRGIKYISMHGIGYGVAAKRYLLALAQTNIPLTWTPMVQGNAWKLGYEPFLGNSLQETFLDGFCNKKIEYDTVIIHTVPEYYPKWIEVEKNKKIIGCTVWETTAIPKHWKDLLNSTDQLIVPCQWNKEVFQNCGVTKPIVVIPHVMEEQELPKTENIFDISQTDYVFYSINMWIERKCIWKTIEAYCEAFTGNDATLLVVKTSRIDFTKRFLGKYFWTSKMALNKLLKKYKNPPKIKLITRELTDKELLQLHARGDCYISLCHSEGWGLGAFDAAKFAKPVIMTGFGGQLDYLDKDLSNLVKYDLVSVVDKLAPNSYSSDQQWAEPDLRHAKELLKYVFENREQVKEKAILLQKQIKEKFNSQAISKQLSSVFVMK